MCQVLRAGGFLENLTHEIISLLFYSIRIPASSRDSREFSRDEFLFLLLSDGLLDCISSLSLLRDIRRISGLVLFRPFMGVSPNRSKPTFFKFFS